jgi:hypothetical protein
VWHEPVRVFMEVVENAGQESCDRDLWPVRASAHNVYSGSALRSGAALEHLLERPNWLGVGTT